MYTQLHNQKLSRLFGSWAAMLLSMLLIVTLTAGCAAPASAPAGTPAAIPAATSAAPVATEAPAATATAAPQAGGMPALPPGADPNAPPPAGAMPASMLTPTMADIPYASLSAAQTLDLYLPSGTGPFPVVVNIHPGGFFTGAKEMLPGVPGQAMLDAGYAIASINYRLSAEAQFPAAVHDAKAAVRFLRANAAKYNLDPDKIAAFGQSAGGKLASMLGTSAGVAELEGAELGNAEFSSNVQAVINWFGPSDFTQLDAQAKAQGCAESDQTHSAVDSPESKYLGAAVPSVTELAQKANPISYISPATPPFLVQKGDQDCTIPVENTKMLADALSAAGVDVQYQLLENVGHGDGFGATTPVFESASNSQILVDFLNSKLAAAPTAAAPAGAPAGMPARGPGGPGGGGSMPATTAQADYADLAYATLSPTQKLDLYLPDGSGPYPVVLMVHGGGFMMGDKADPMGTAGVDQLLAAGYAAAVVNYRLSAEAKAPAQIQDVKAAVRFLRANAAQYNLTDKIAGWGGSAGGSLVALLGTSCGVAELEGAELGNAEQSSCIQAVVDQFGPTDFLQMDQQFTGTTCPVTHDAADSPESMVIGAPIQSVPELVQKVNPITYVSAQAPAFLIQHGTADCNVPPQQSQLLYDALLAVIGPDMVTLTILEGAGHGGAQFWEAENVAMIMAFLDKYLK